MSEKIYHEGPVRLGDVLERFVGPDKPLGLCECDSLLSAWSWFGFDRTLQEIDATGESLGKDDLVEQLLSLKAQCE